MVLLSYFLVLSIFSVDMPLTVLFTSEAYTSPSIVLAARGAHGIRVIFDDYHEAYFWLRRNTLPEAKVMSWWDYAYQITALGNRTVIFDKNTWNNTHIATVGRAMSSYEDEAYEIMKSLEVDYVLVVFAGITGYSSDDVNKFQWMVRIGGGVFPLLKEPDYLINGKYLVDNGAVPKMLNCLMYKLCNCRFGELTTEYGKPPGYDRARGVEIETKTLNLSTWKRHSPHRIGLFVFIRMNTRVSRRSEVPSYRDTRNYWAAGQHTNKPCRFVPNEISLQSTPRNSAYMKLNKHEADGIISSNAKGNSSQICKYWIKGNCAHGDRCWNVHSWFHGDGLSILTKLHQHKKIVTGIRLPVGSDKLFSCSTDGTLRMWDCHTGQCVNATNLGDEARCLISMGSWVFAGMRSAIKGWNIQTGAEITLDGPKGHVLSMAVCNNTLFAGAMDGVIYVWRLSSEGNFPFKSLGTLTGHTKAVVCLTGGPEDKLYSGSVDHSIKAWDLNTLQCTTLKGHTDVVTSLILWDKYLFSSSLDGTVKIWTAAVNGTLEVVYTHHEESGVVKINGMIDAKGKSILFCSCKNHSVGLYEMPTFAARGRLFSKQEIRVIEEGPNGLFFTGDGTGLLTVWKWLAETEPETTSS